MAQARGTGRIFTVLLLAFGVVHATSQPRPLKPAHIDPVTKTSTVTQGSIAVTLVALPNGSPMAGGSTGHGSLALGKVSSGAMTHVPGVRVDRRQSSMIVSTSFGVRLDDGGGGAGSARLSAFLFHPDSRYAVSIDGVKLDGSARVIQTGLRYGAITPHRLEIEIPSSVPETEGNLANNIGFLAIPN